MNIMCSDFIVHPHSKMQSTDADRKYYTDRNGPDRRVPQIRKKMMIFFFLRTTDTLVRYFYIGNGSVYVFSA